MLVVYLKLECLQYLVKKVKFYLKIRLNKIYLYFFSYFIFRFIFFWIIYIFIVDLLNLCATTANPLSAIIAISIFLHVLAHLVIF